MSTVELNDHPHNGSVARHREGTELARECRRVFEPITASPRESDRHIGRIVQIDAWIGSAAQRDGAAQNLTGPAVSTRVPVIEVDAGASAGRTQLSRPFGQDAARVGLEPAGGLRQRRAAGAGGAEQETGHENERADLRDPHGGTLASSWIELGRLTQGDGNVMR